MENREQFSQIVFVMEGFHIPMVFVGTICKQFEEAGIHDVMVESGIVGPSAISKVLSGKHYNCGMRSHQMDMEAFQ